MNFNITNLSSEIKINRSKMIKIAIQYSQFPVNMLYAADIYALQTSVLTTLFQPSPKFLCLPSPVSIFQQIHYFTVEIC